VIRIERERPFAVSGQTPLPTTPQVPGAFVSAIAPPAPAKPSCHVGHPAFTRRSEALAPMGVCSPDCRVVAEGSDIRYAHRFSCLKSDLGAINVWSRPRNDASQPKSKQNRCGYCESVRHTSHSDCPDFLRHYAVNTGAASQPPPPPSNPLPERMDEDVSGEDGFSGMIPLGVAPAATLVAVEEIFRPVVETLEEVEIWVILTPPCAICGNS